MPKKIDTKLRSVNRAKKKKSGIKTKAKTSLWTKLSRQSTSRKLAIFALAFGIIGAVVLIQSHASPQPYTYTEIATQGLDSSGKTIPKTNYAIPANAVFLATNGNDTNDGKSKERPVKTVTKALTILNGMGGGTLVVRGGEYRDGYINSSNKAIRFFEKPLTIQAYPGESPWFTGTDVISTDWVKQGSVWSHSWSTPQFCNGTYDTGSSNKDNLECVYPDSVADPAYPVAGDPQLAFANDTQLEQKGQLSDVIAGSKSFYYDWNAKRIYISEDPSKANIELATRQGFIVFGGPQNFSIKGIGFKRYASALKGNVNGSVVYVGLASPLNSNGYFSLENSVFTENAGTTLSLSGPKNGTSVKSSVFAYNHSTGMAANGFANDRDKYNAPSGLILEGNIFNANNQANFDSRCNASCGSAAVKLNHMVEFTVKNNIFENTLGKNGEGFWCDMNCSQGVIVNNISRNNGGSGIFYEISNTGIVAGNLVYNNGGAGLRIPSANTKVYNNTVVNKPGPLVEGVWLFDDPRTAPDNGQTWPYTNPRYDLGPNTNNVEFANNLIVGQSKNGTEYGARLLNFSHSASAQIPPNTTADSYFSVLDNNVYYQNQKQKLYMWKLDDTIMSPTELRTKSGKQFELNSQVVRGGDITPDPFVSRADLDFRLDSNSQAYKNPSRAIPSDVAKAMGISTELAKNPGIGAIYATSASIPTPPKPNQPPTISLSGMTSPLTQPADVTLTATANDADGNVAKVEFYNGSTKIGESVSNTGTYSYTWKNVPVGNYTFVAKAYDNVGDSSSSSPRQVVVNAKAPDPTPPTPSPEDPSTDNTAPSAPSNINKSLRADLFRGKYVIDFNWKPSTDASGIKEYRVSRNGSRIATTTQPSFTDSSASANINYSYSFVAVDNSISQNISNPTIVGAKASCFWIFCSLE